MDSTLPTHTLNRLLKMHLPPAGPATVTLPIRTAALASGMPDTVFVHPPPPVNTSQRRRYKVRPPPPPDKRH